MTIDNWRNTGNRKIWIKLLVFISSHTTGDVYLPRKAVCCRSHYLNHCRRRGAADDYHYISATVG